MCLTHLYNFQHLNIIIINMYYFENKMLTNNYSCIFIRGITVEALLFLPVFVTFVGSLCILYFFWLCIISYFYSLMKCPLSTCVLLFFRLFVLVLVVISIIWIPVIQASQGSELFVYIQQVSSFMQPPICCIFILGLFWERLNEKVSSWKKHLYLYELFSIGYYMYLQYQSMHFFSNICKVM